MTDLTGLKHEDLRELIKGLESNIDEFFSTVDQVKEAYGEEDLTKNVVEDVISVIIKEKTLGEIRNIIAINFKKPNSNESSAIKGLNYISSSYNPCSILYVEVISPYEDIRKNINKFMFEQDDNFNAIYNNGRYMTLIDNNAYMSIDKDLQYNNARNGGYNVSGFSTVLQRGCGLHGK